MGFRCFWNRTVKYIKCLGEGIEGMAMNILACLKR